MLYIPVRLIEGSASNGDIFHKILENRSARGEVSRRAKPHVRHRTGCTYRRSSGEVVSLEGSRQAGSHRQRQPGLNAGDSSWCTVVDGPRIVWCSSGYFEARCSQMSDELTEECTGAGSDFLGSARCIG